MWFKHTSEMSPVPIFEKNNYTVELEVKDNHPFLHLRVSKLTHNTVKDMIVNVELVSYLLGSMGYPYVFGAISPRNSRQEKLFGMLGMKRIVDEENMAVFVLTTDNDDIPIHEE